MAYFIISGVFFILLLLLWIRFNKIQASLKAKNKELRVLYGKTELQSQQRQEFIATLSQELRTPLYGIMGLTGLLAEEYPEFRNNKNLKSLKFAGDYLLSFINNVLQINLLDSEDRITQDVVFNLKEVMQNLVSSFCYATENTDNELHFEFDPEIIFLVKGDQAVLTQILMNLISNSLRYTRNGKVLFSVDLIKKTDQALSISFSVKHNGSDLSEEDQASIYEEFVNTCGAKRSCLLGTGLNSSILKKLATALNSEIIIRKNSTYLGSEYFFIVDFKIYQSNEATENTLDGSFSGTKLKVLVVDDNKLNLLVADKILSKENFDCTTVDNGFDAIEMVKAINFDIILMDINMPDLNGIGTTKKIREFNTTTPIIALTAVDITQLNRQIIQAGLNDYILKPYDKNNLLEITRKHIKK